MDWPEIKTSHEGLFSFHADCECLETDEFHSLGSYVITQSGDYSQAAVDPSGPQWVFPSFLNTADGGAMSKVSRILKSLVGEVDGVLENMSARSLHAGSVDEMAFNVNCHIVDMISHDNWDFRADYFLFNHLTKKLHVAQAGKALAGWLDCQMRVSVPSLAVILSADNKRKVETYAAELFSK